MKGSRQYQLNAFRICIDTDEEDITGTAFSPLCNSPIKFFGLGELLVKIDALFDKEGYPQSFQDKRSFEEGKRIQNRYGGMPEYQMEPEMIEREKGKRATFDIVITTRRNTSWQGNLIDFKGELLKKFTGELELLEGILSYLGK